MTDLSAFACPTPSLLPSFIEALEKARKAHPVASWKAFVKLSPIGPY